MVVRKTSYVHRVERRSVHAPCFATTNILMASLKTDKVEQDDGFTKVGGFKYAPVRGRGGKKRRGQRGAAAPASAEEQLEEAKQKLERRRDIVQGKQRLLDEGDLGQRIRGEWTQAPYCWYETDWYLVNRLTGPSIGATCKCRRSRG